MDTPVKNQRAEVLQSADLGFVDLSSSVVNVGWQSTGLRCARRYIISIRVLFPSCRNIAPNFTHPENVVNVFLKFPTILSKNDC